ncbi:c-type cytochrome [Erythrobacter donghaensis]|jgi:mono/diheme cytochrome c family protein|uniref:c-type cytochrome n=1 Tax=Erythrobacter donghaensis TaxID=267135 RepID=UPI00093D4FE1|nr:c-type cytochrome [Erythrobacter donghaensis]
MGKARRIFGWTAIGLASLIALVSSAVYGLSEARLAKTYVPATRFSHPPGDAVEGARLARVLGCTDCHGDDLTGKVMFSQEGVATLYASNLTTVVPRLSDSQFASALRDGLRPDGTGLFIMPSSRLRLLTDRETADLLAYLRTLSPRGSDRPPFSLGPLGRLGIALGKLRNEPDTLAEDALLRAAEIEGHEEGRRLAEATCAECHGADLNGSHGALKAPNLLVTAGYSASDFSILLRTGKAIGGRDLPVMSETARKRYPSLTENEVEQLHGYLLARAEAVAGN